MRPPEELPGWLPDRKVLKHGRMLLWRQMLLLPRRICRVSLGRAGLLSCQQQWRLSCGICWVPHRFRSWNSIKLSPDALAERFSTQNMDFPPCLKSSEVCPISLRWSRREQVPCWPWRSTWQEGERRKRCREIRCGKNCLKVRCVI